MAAHDLKYEVIARDWPGETVFIIGGGTSVTQANVDLLKGRRVIVVNTSYRLALWADILYFADQRWWERERELPENTLKDFQGTIYTVSRLAKGRMLKRLHRVLPEKEGIAARPDTVTMQYTSAQAAMNIAVHKGARRIVLVGIDNRPSEEDPRKLHHHEEYPWPAVRTTWDIKNKNFAYAVPELEKLGIEVVNTSPISTLEYWPHKPLDQVLAEEDRK